MLENVEITDTYVAQWECQACNSFVIEFKARSSKHYFNCGQPVVGDTRATRYHFFFPHVQNLDGGYRAMFLRSTSPDIREVNKSEVWFTFWNLYYKCSWLRAKWRKKSLFLV